MSLLGPMHGACTAGSGGVDVSGRLDLVLRDKAALARAGGSIALRHHGGCYGDFPGVQIVLIDLERSATVTSIDGVLDVSSQGNSPAAGIAVVAESDFRRYRGVVVRQRNVRRIRVSPDLL